MKFDILMPGTNRAPNYAPFAHQLRPTEYRQILELVDDLRFSTVSICEHVAMPHHEVPRLGAHWDEVLATMAFVIGATRRVRVDTAVLVAPLHHPLRLAKSLATMDQLSEGRVAVSVGVGHAEQEFAALGVPFNKRGAIADEVLEALTTLWSSPEAEYHGKFFVIEGLAIEPRPYQQPRIPIYVGGNSKPALRRAARYDGWQPNPTNFDITEIPALMGYIREQESFAGKEDTFDVNWLCAPETAELPNEFASVSPSELRGYRDALLEAYAGQFPELGITRTAAVAPLSIKSVPEYLDWLRWFSAEIIEGLAE